MFGGCSAAGVGGRRGRSVAGGGVVLALMLLLAPAALRFGRGPEISGAFGLAIGLRVVLALIIFVPVVVMGLDEGEADDED